MLCCGKVSYIAVVGGTNNITEFLDLECHCDLSNALLF